MKIAYCIPSIHSSGGMERVLTLKANYLTDILHHEVYIILTEGTEEKPYYKLSPNIKVINLEVNFDKLYGLPIYRRLPQHLYKQGLFKAKLRKILFFIKPQITVSLLRRDIDFICSIKDGSIKVGELHFGKKNFRGLGEYHLPTFIRKPLANLWMGQFTHKLKKLDKFVVLTHEDKENWKDLDNVIVIHNPLTFFPEKISDCTHRQVIAAGRYESAKGFDKLIEAWGIISSKHPDWKLQIYGQGDREQYKEQIEKLNIKENCIINPPTLDIEEKYLESSIFALSSKNEGFGLVIVEAMACGVPPVSFACPCGPKEIIQDGEDGLLVENGNIEELAHKINYLIENEDIRKKMGQQARINVERFKIESIGKQWETLFQNLLIESNNNSSI